MKKYFLLLAFGCYVVVSNAQNVGIGTPNPQNKLHVAGGFRLDTLTSVNGAGILKHDANGVVHGIKFSGNIGDVLRGDGTFGVGGAGAVGWMLNGNSGTNDAINFLGTTDDKPLLFRVNNIRYGGLSHHIFFGKEAGNSNVGIDNIGIGSGALYNNTIRNGLVAVGDSALFNNGLSATGIYDAYNNTAIGSKTLFKNTKGYNNTAIGFSALYSNLDGFQNTAVGNWSLLLNTSGSYNTAVGSEALSRNTTGISNTALGFWAMLLNTTGARNTAVGNEALSRNTIAADNTALGYFALLQNTTGTSNTAVGSGALYGNTTGLQNIAIGKDALASNNNGSANTAVGYEGMFANTSGTNNSAFGWRSLRQNSSGGNNDAFGVNALFSNQTGSNNAAFGNSALAFNITGYGNTAIGSFSQFNNNGYYNASLGANSLSTNTTGHDNTAIGSYTMNTNSDGIFNTAIGAFAMNKNSSGRENVADGYKALEQNTTGSYNTASGVGALEGNTSSFYNSAFGHSALGNNTGNSANRNSAFGTYALLSNTGFDNTAVGYSAGNDFNYSNSNTMIGARAHVGLGSNNCIAIGFNAFTNVTNVALLGSTTSGPIGGYGPWTNFSDSRFKKGVQENVKGLDFILRLRPVTYQMDVKGLHNFWGIGQYGKNDSLMNTEMKMQADESITKKESIRMSGFLAQEVEKAAEETGYDFDGVIKPAHNKDHYRIAYAEFVVPLVKAVQEQQTIIEKQQKLMDELLKRVQVLEKQ